MGKRGPSSLFSALPKELADTLKNSLKPSPTSQAESGPSTTRNTLHLASTTGVALEAEVEDPYEGLLVSDRMTLNDDGPPNKRQKKSHKEKQKETRSSERALRGKYDASDLVTRYTDETHVPEHLQKCTSASVKPTPIPPHPIACQPAISISNATCVN